VHQVGKLLGTIGCVQVSSLTLFPLHARFVKFRKREYLLCCFCPSAWNNLTPTGRVFMELKSLSVFLRMRNGSDISCRENRSTQFVFNNFFPENLAFHACVCVCVEEAGLIRSVRQLCKGYFDYASGWRRGTVRFTVGVGDFSLLRVFTGPGDLAASCSMAPRTFSQRVIYWDVKRSIWCQEWEWMEPYLHFLVCFRGLHLFKRVRSAVGS